MVAERSSIFHNGHTVSANPPRIRVTFRSGDGGDVDVSGEERRRSEPAPLFHWGPSARRPRSRSSPCGIDKRCCGDNCRFGKHHSISQKIVTANSLRSWADSSYHHTIIDTYRRDFRLRGLGIGCSRANLRRVHPRTKEHRKRTGTLPLLWRRGRYALSTGGNPTRQADRRPMARVERSRIVLRYGAARGVCVPAPPPAREWLLPSYL
jgi:hypothetical protein